MLYPNPAARGAYPDGDGPPVGARPPIAGISLRAAAVTCPFWLIFVASAISSLGMFVPFVHLVKFSVDQGHNESWSILLISLIGIGSITGRLILGGVADRLGRHRAVVAMFVGIALVHSWWYLSTSFWALAIYAVLFGVFYGGYVALAPSLLADYFGARNVGSILGVQYAGVGIGNLVGPVAMGFAFDLTGGYDLPIAASAATSFLAVAIIFLLRSPEQWRQS